MNNTTNRRTIEVDGFEIELTSELTCHQAGDHAGLAESARIDLAQLGHRIDDLAVVCMRCVKAIPLKVR